MAFVYNYTVVNRNGSVYISSTGVSVNTSNVVFNFPDTGFANRPYLGTVFVNLAQAIPAGTTTTLPILFDSQPVTKYNGEPLTVADIAGTGVYQFWFNRQTGVLQIMTGLVQPAAAA